MGSTTRPVITDEVTEHFIALRNMLLLLLACAAGGVDAISYAGLGRVFTANMTGNTVLLGLALAQVEPQAITRAGAALLGFVIGTAVSTWIVGQQTVQSVWSVKVTRALAVESAILVGVLACWRIVSDPIPSEFWQLILIAGTAVAMGVQSTAIRDLSISGVATTYITPNCQHCEADSCTCSEHVTFASGPRAHRRHAVVVGAVAGVYRRRGGCGGAAGADTQLGHAGTDCVGSADNRWRTSAIWLR